MKHIPQIAYTLKIYDIIFQRKVCLKHIPDITFTLNINVMPARIAGGRLLLEHTDETASSEAAGQHRIWQQKLSSKPNGGGGTRAINSESRPNWTKLNYEQDNLFIWSRCYLGKAPLPGEICSLFLMKLVLRETSKKCPEFKCAPPLIWLENDIIVHLHWNTPHKRGGKQSGDVDWLIITKPCLLSTQEAWLQLRGICNVVYYFMILILGVTVVCDSVALTSVSDKS